MISLSPRSMDRRSPVKLAQARMRRLSVLDRIRAANAGRDPERLRRKYREHMRTTRAGFFRGTCHLMWEDWSPPAALSDAPSTWSCGDLHFENLGAYKGSTRVPYFDLTDFDEGALAPASCDVTRFATSILVAAQDRKTDAGIPLARLFVDTYAEVLGGGKARWVERETATGPVRALLRTVRDRRRRTLLDERTKLKAGQRTIRVDGKKALPLGDGERDRVVAILARIARSHPRQHFFDVIDAARRIAGNGSLGVPRWVVLVQGRGSPDRNYLLDLKLARASALAPYVDAAQPEWSCDAERVVSVQTLMQAVPPAHLAWVRAGARSFVLRELQPQEDRLDLEAPGLRRKHFVAIATTMAKAIGWAHLRSSGQRGSANADALIAWGRDPRWRPRVLDYAQSYAVRVDRDWREFRAALADGYFEPTIGG